MYACFRQVDAAHVVVLPCAIVDSFSDTLLSRSSLGKQEQWPGSEGVYVYVFEQNTGYLEVTLGYLGTNKRKRVVFAITFDESTFKHSSKAGPGHGVAHVCFNVDVVPKLIWLKIIAVVV